MPAPWGSGPKTHRVVTAKQTMLVKRGEERKNRKVGCHLVLSISPFFPIDMVSLVAKETLGGGSKVISSRSASEVTFDLHLVIFLDSRHRSTLLREALGHDDFCVQLHALDYLRGFETLRSVTCTNQYACNKYIGCAHQCSQERCCSGCWTVFLQTSGPLMSVSSSS